MEVRLPVRIRVRVRVRVRRTLTCARVTVVCVVCSVCSVCDRMCLSINACVCLRVSMHVRV